MRNSVIIVAGGSGTRMGHQVPKQFLELEGKPVLMHSMECFSRFDPSIDMVLVLPEDQTDSWKELCRVHQFSLRHHLVKGGKSRFHSVRNGLEVAEKSGLIAVHDGVRPLVSRETIGRCFREAGLRGAAIPVLPVSETVRRGTMEQSETVDRAQYYTVQTPQVFQAGILAAAYKQSWRESFTDDASVVEQSGCPVTMVLGNPENIKITYPQDLIIASAFIKHKKDTN